MHKENAPIYKLSCSKAPKTQQIFYYRHETKTRGYFLLYNTGIDFRFCNNFANVSSFSNVSVPVETITP